MTKLNKQIVIALLGLGGVCGTINDLYACGGGGGGRGRSVGGYGLRVSLHSQPQHRPVHYQQPRVHVVSQPAPVVRHVAQPSPPQVIVHQKPVQQFQQVTTQRPIIDNGNAQANALQMLGESPSQVESRQVDTQPVQNEAPMQGNQFASEQPASQQNPMAEAQQSALQALADMGDDVASAQQTPTAEAAQSGPQAEAADPWQPVTQSQVTRNAGHVGQWKANLANGTAVNLALQADGTFVWVAITSGKASSFHGSYTLDGGLLTLVRSSDNQKLAGSLTSMGDGGMNFRLNGAKDNGLNFDRS